MNRLFLCAILLWIFSLIGFGFGNFIAHLQDRTLDDKIWDIIGAISTFMSTMVTLFIGWIAFKLQQKSNF